MYVINDLGDCSGYEALTPTTSKGFTAAKINAQSAFSNQTVKAVMVKPEDYQIRFRMDGTAPTATVGMDLEAGGVLTITGHTNISKFRCIDTSDGASTVHCMFFV